VPLLDATGEDTLELELNAEQMLSLSRSDAAICPMTLPVPAAEKPLAAAPEHRRDPWPGVILTIATASVLSGGIAYLATIPPEPFHVSANTLVRPPAAETPAPPSADIAPVQFTNPFDATEVFEFPLGTSETKARQAVADVLLQRAHERQNAAKITRQRRETADRIAPARTVQSRPTQLTSAGRLRSGERFGSKDALF
jgi:hypothetical protein